MACFVIPAAMRGLPILFLLLFCLADWSCEADDKAEGKGSATVKTGDDKNEADVKLTATGSGDQVTSSSKMEASADEKSGKTNGEASAKVEKKKKKKKSKAKKAKKSNKQG